MNAKKILHFSVGPMGAAVLGLVTLPVVAWLFSPEDVGRLTMLQVTVSFSLLLFSLGLDQAYVREFHEVEDKPALLKAVILPGLVVLIVVLLAASFSPWSLSGLLFDIDSVWLTFFLLVSILLSFCSRFLSLVLRMQERGLAFSMSQLLPKLLFLAIVLGYIWLGAEAIFDNLMIANVLSLVAVFVIYSWNTRNDWRPALTAHIDKSKQNQMICYAVPLVGGGLAFWGLTAMDKIFLRSLSSFEELGIYSIAVSFAGAALVFQAIFSTVWVPVVYKWAAEGVDSKKIKDVMDHITLAVIVIWTLAGMFSWVVTYILPPEYEKVKIILLAAMAYPLLYTLSQASGVGIGIKRKTLYSMVAAVIALVVNAIGNWLFIPTYGAAGAAMTSAGAFFIFFVIRTEASSILWNSFERWRMYGFVVMALTGSLLVILLEPESVWVVGASFILMVLVICFFREQVAISGKFVGKELGRVWHKFMRAE